MNKSNITNIIFEVTTDCNLNCAYCYNHWKGGETFEHLNSYKKATRVLKQLFKTTNFGQITFTGGEPFLGERFLELVLLARINQKRVNIISNGNGGNLKDYQSLMRMGVKLFQFPFLSDNKEIHDNLTGVEGSWNHVLTSIAEVLSLGARVVPVIVLTKRNYKNLDKTLTFVHDMGLDRIMLNRYNIGGKGIHGNDLVLTKPEISEAFRVADTIAHEKQMTISSNVCSPICYIDPGQYPNIGFGHCSMNLSRRPITVNINGDVRLCNHSPIIAGNVFKSNFDEIFQTEYCQSWNALKPEFCSNCQFYEKCLGGCRAASEQMGQTLSSPDPVLEQM